MFEARLVMFAYRRIARQQLVAAQQQFRKIHHAFALALCIVFGEYLHLAPRVGIESLHFLCAQALLLAAADKILHLARRVFFVVDIQSFHYALDSG